MGLLYKSKPYFSDKNYLQFKKVILDPRWNTVPCLGGGGSVALVLLDRMQSRACGLINSPIITSQIPALYLRRDVASLSLFYRYFFAHCSDEHRAIIPPFLLRGRPTTSMESAHGHSLAIPSCRTTSFKKSVLPCVFKLWISMSHAQRCFISLKRNATISFFPVGIFW